MADKRSGWQSLEGGKAGASPRDPDQGRCPWTPPRASPWDPFILVVEWEGADRDLEWSMSAPSHSTTNRRIAKALPLLGVEGAKPLAGFRAEP